MVSRILRNLFAFACIATAVIASGSSAHAVTINPGMFGLRFDDPTQSGVEFRAFFGNVYNNNPQMLSYELNLDAEAGTASVFFNNLSGNIFAGDDFRGDATPLADVSLNLAFTWTGITQDENGNLVLRDPSGSAGAVASLTSDYFDGGSVSFALSPKGSTNSNYYPASADNPVYFFLGQSTHPYFGGEGNTLFSAWVMGNSPVSINGRSYNVAGDFHGSAEVPEPASLLLLGSGVMFLRRKRSHA